MTSSIVVESTSRIRLAAFWTTIPILLLILLELGSAVVVRVLVSTQYRYLLWNPDLSVVSAAWSENAAKTDEELGWPLADWATSGTRDASGAKRNADFPDASEPCLSAYGDSFIWGDDVPLQDGWIEQLSRLLGCRVANFGVSGYGTDQAYLRFRRLTFDKAPVVILGIFPDDIVRNVNQYRAFLGMELEPFLVKGRFVLDGDQNLQWIARPALDSSSFLELHRKPNLFLPHEHLLPGTQDGPVAVRFPYTLTLMRFTMAPRVWNRLRGQTPWFDFYSPKHASGAVPLTLAIARAFAQEAERRGARAITIMLPSAGSFRAWSRFGAPDYADFVKAAADAGLNIFDPLPAVARQLEGRDHCTLYAREASCGGHFGVAGSALIAEVVAAELKRRNLAMPKS
jgi:hypothetical protein